MKYCQNCGNTLPDEAVFCGNCGTPVKTATSKATEEIPVKKQGKLSFEIIRKEEFNMVKVNLENAAFRYEAGALHYMIGNLKLESKAPGMGKMMKSLVTRAGCKTGDQRHRRSVFTTFLRGVLYNGFAK